MDQTRAEKVSFIVQAIYDIEGEEVPPEHFENDTDEKLDELVGWYDYLYGK